ncbi:MAG: hypothetical protein U0470_11875 [Anaerolineae bacterium]
MTAVDRRRSSAQAFVLAAALAAALTVAAAPLAPRALADGGPENALLVIDPGDADSLYLGHLYASTRGIPPGNVLYMPPAADDYASWAAFQRHAVTGTLASRGLAHVDHIVIAPSHRFYIPMATNLVSTGCVIVSRMSLSSAYTFLPEADEVLGGKLTDQDLNRYRGDWRRPSDAVAFDSRTRWYGGKPATSGGSRRYFIGTLLGYLGERGNTVDEIAAMIARSAAVDGTRPDGTFYFMTTPDGIRSYRHEDFPAVIKAITGMGGKAEALDGVLPIGRHDALGILTGITHPAPIGADVTMLPGAFADHLTSFAGMFDDGSQEKMSSWITAGASGSLGTVEEPCTGGKFPDAALHAFYYAGLPLGEAIFRSVQWSAFQSLFYGDPLTRPFAHIPVVTASGLPADPATVVKGIVQLTATATTTAPSATIASYALYVDGVPAGTSTDGKFAVDTTLLADGWHDVRVTAVDSTPTRGIVGWSGAMTVGNAGRSVELTILPRFVDPLGDRTNLVVDVNGGAATEIRVLEGSRIVGALGPGETTFQPPLSLFGAGPVLLRAVAEFADGPAATSAPVEWTIGREEAAEVLPSVDPLPIAFAYTTDLRPGRPRLLDLPGFAENGSAVTLAVTSPPAQSTVRMSGAAALLWPHADAAGTDTLTFSVTNAAGAVASAVVTLHYCPAGAPDVPVAPGLPDPCRNWTPPPTVTPGPSPTATRVATATVPGGARGRAFLPVGWVGR